MAEDLPWRFWDETAERWRTHDFWREAFAWHGAATPHVLPRVAAFGLISVLICAAAGPRLAIPVGPHEVAGAVPGLLLILRTDAGYERWWEARRPWGGIVNQARNPAIQALAYGPGDPLRREQAVRQTIAFAHVARHTLRGERELPEVAALLGAGPAARIARRTCPTPSPGRSAGPSAGRTRGGR
jgi:putative membrane protein